MAHYGGHLREAFLDWVDQSRPDVVSLEVDHEEVVWPVIRFMELMSRCSDVLPGSTCDDLGLARGSTYAAAARMVLREKAKEVD